MICPIFNWLVCFLVGLLVGRSFRQSVFWSVGRWANKRLDRTTTQLNVSGNATQCPILMFSVTPCLLRYLLSTLHLVHSSTTERLWFGRNKTLSLLCLRYVKSYASVLHLSLRSTFRFKSKLLSTSEKMPVFKTTAIGSKPDESINKI